MAFLVEDGSGLVNANSYIDVAGADSYHADRQTAIWVNETDTNKKESALIRASEYIDAQYSRRFRGMRKTETQGLQWPRTGAQYDNNMMISGVPVEVIRATVEMAARALTNPNLLPDVDVVTHGPNVLEVTEKVDTIMTKIKYASSAQAANSPGLTPGEPIDAYPFISLLLLPVIDGSRLPSTLAVGVVAEGLATTSPRSKSPDWFAVGQFDDCRGCKY